MHSLYLSKKNLKRIILLPLAKVFLSGCDELRMPGARGRMTCSQAGSFSNAQGLLRAGHSVLDGDNDGIAFEHLK
tara:strand:- start:1103 stop:1327 length:225 start_codon:yes stop_codon:yes gene_type:complete